MYLAFFLATRFLKDFLSSKKSFICSARLAGYVQDLMQDPASLARKILTRLAYIWQDGFYWAVNNQIIIISMLSSMKIMARRWIANRPIEGCGSFDLCITQVLK